MKSWNFKFGIVVAVGKSMDQNSQPSKMVAMETKNIIKINFEADEWGGLLQNRCKVILDTSEIALDGVCCHGNGF